MRKVNKPQQLLQPWQTWGPVPDEPGHRYNQRLSPAGGSIAVSLIVTDSPHQSVGD